MPQRGRALRAERLPDDVTEIIHFVRNFQGLQRETTEMRLTKKAPLPSIGHTVDLLPRPVLPEVAESPRGGGTFIIGNNNVLDNGCPEEDDAAYVSDTEQELELELGPEYNGYQGYQGPAAPLPAPRRPSHPLVEPQNANQLSRSLDGIPEDQPSRLQPLAQPGRRSKGAGHHLPPMEKEHPDRPTAPRPTSGRSEPRPKTGFGNRSKSGYGDRPKSGYVDRPKSSYGDRPKTGHGDRSKMAHSDRPKSGQCRPKSGYGRRREPPRPSAPSPSVTPTPSTSQQEDSDSSDPIDFIDSR